MAWAYSRIFSGSGPHVAAQYADTDSVESLLLFVGVHRVFQEYLCLGESRLPAFVGIFAGFDTENLIGQIVRSYELAGVGSFVFGVKFLDLLDDAPQGIRWINARQAGGFAEESGLLHSLGAACLSK